MKMKCINVNLTAGSPRYITWILLWAIYVYDMWKMATRNPKMTLAWPKQATIVESTIRKYFPIFGTQVTSNAIAAKIMHMIMRKRVFPTPFAWLTAWAIRFQFPRACCEKGSIDHPIDWLTDSLTDGSFVFWGNALAWKCKHLHDALCRCVPRCFFCSSAVASSVWKLFALLWFSLFFFIYLFFFFAFHCKPAECVRQLSFPHSFLAGCKLSELRVKGRPF